MRAVLLGLCLLVCSTAFALDKQGVAHAGGSGEDDKRFNLSGSAMLGTALYNPSYAARPDNTGLALMRYAAHLDLDVIGAYLSVPLDLNLFTDRTLHGAEIFKPTEFDVISGLTTTWPLGPGSLEGGMRVEHDRPVDHGTFTQTYLDFRARYVYSAAQLLPALKRALIDGDISGWFTFGWFGINPSYAARPDNTGLALFRYAAHAELSVWHDYISLGADATMFTDRSKRAFRPSELDFTGELIGHWRSVELHIAYERDMPVDRPGYVQDFVYALLVWSFDLRSAVTKAYLSRAQIISP